MISNSVYKIRGEKPEDLRYEINRIFELIADRFDKVEGYRGHLTSYNYIEAQSDVVVMNSTKGIVLKDAANPPNYWRLNLDTTGTLTLTNIGRVYP